MVNRLPDELTQFIRAHLGSVWALELMLKMMSRPDLVWTVEQLVRELRATDLLVSGLLARFERAGFVVSGGEDAWQWRPANPQLDQLSRQTAEAHAATPFAVVQVIAEAPAYSLQEFADAFRLRRDKGDKGKP
jgi:UDP-N-acetylglucosamine enolpyruvyl transferase